MRGELDWIVMKCLEKDRSRRYETANGLARDLERYLADEPVEACPPSSTYRLRKLAGKYKKTLVTATAFMVLLVAGLLVSSWLAIVANRAHTQRLSLSQTNGLNANRLKTNETGLWRQRTKNANSANRRKPSPTGPSTNWRSACCTRSNTASRIRLRSVRLNCAASPIGPPSRTLV